MLDALVYSYSHDALDGGDMMYDVISLINKTIPSIVELKHIVYNFSNLYFMAISFSFST